MALPKRTARDNGGSQGQLAVGDDYSNILQRHTACAELRSHQISTFSADRLIDCHIEWMSEEAFELGGLRVRSAYQDQPEQLERVGWLVDVDIRQRELTKKEARLLR